MLSCNGCKNRNTYVCRGCVGLNRYESNTLMNPTLAIDIDKEMKMLAKAGLNDLFGIKNAERKTDMRIKKVYFNDPVTVVLWEDGTKTIVRAGENEIYDPEKGLAMAIAKKALGNQGNYYEVFKKWLPEEVNDEYDDQIEQMKEYIDELDKELHKIEEEISYQNMEEVDVTENTTKDKTRQIQWLSPKEVAEANGLSVECVRKRIKDGFIPLAEKVNGKWKIPCYVFDDHVEVKCM